MSTAGSAQHRPANPGMSRPGASRHGMAGTARTPREAARDAFAEDPRLLDETTAVRLSELLPGSSEEQVVEAA